MNGKSYKSCLTSYAFTTQVIYVKRNGLELITFEEFCKHVGNKSVFMDDELWRKYQTESIITLMQLLYGDSLGQTMQTIISKI